MKEKFEEIAARYKIPVERVEKEYTNFVVKAKPIVAKEYPDNAQEETDKRFIQSLSKIFKPDAYTLALQAEKDGKLNNGTPVYGVIGTIISVAPRTDKNSFEAWKRRDFYSKHPNEAVEGGYVREATSKDGKIYPVPMYENKYLRNNKGEDILDDEGNPIPNNQFGQDIPRVWVNKMLMFAPKKYCGEEGDGWKLLYATMPYNQQAEYKRMPGIMRQTKVIGTIRRNPYLQIMRDGYADQGFIDQKEDDIWTLANAILPKEKNYIGLDQVDEQKQNTLWIARANIMSIYLNDDKVSIEMNSDDVVTGVRASSRQPKIVEYVSKQVDKNKEAYVICMRASFMNKEGERVFYNELCGVIPSTGDSLQDEILQALSNN